ncbi:uncharacterized protein [Nicotiana sylvestris]|uniref:uncharacterized protein n=1 Tax=Nicotiana sylvestris TaxID=4096 RepID=UPI00388CE281
MVTTLVATPLAQPARGGGQARYYALPAHTEVVASDSVITSIVLVYHRNISVLFDPGFTFPYVPSYFARHLGVPRDSLSSPIYVSTLVGASLIVDRLYRSCLVDLSGFETTTDLLFLNMVDFDIMLGMDWLSPHFATLDCHAKAMTLAMPAYGSEGCDTYLAYVADVSIDTPLIDSILVVRDFPDVFPADLPGMPPDRDIDFGIDMLLGTLSISIPPYRMAPPELKELKDQLQELLDKGFIRPNVSPWGAPILFVSKKDGSICICIYYR